jgi:hypothetical protein
MNQQSIVPPPPVEFGSFRRLTPISRLWGSDRGQPIDRRYIENFLKRHAGDIRGRVTRQFLYKAVRRQSRDQE